MCTNGVARSAHHTMTPEMYAAAENSAIYPPRLRLSSSRCAARTLKATPIPLNKTNMIWGKMCTDIRLASIPVFQQIVAAWAMRAPTIQC